MITEVFVSVDNLNFTKLDLIKNESIEMKYITKDLQDISKVFSPYSQNFTFQATPKNRMALGFFGDTEVIKANLSNKYYCKVYTNGSLSLTGNLTVESINYKNKIAQYFTASFTTSLTNLKDRIGDTLISDLGTFEVNWNPETVFSLVKGLSQSYVDGVELKYFVPLISSNRVWSSDPTFTAGYKDNVAYNVANTGDSINLIKADELRPAIKFKTLIELIKQKYNLDVLTPLDNRPEFTDAFIWCNSEKIYAEREQRLQVNNGLGGISFVNSHNESDIPDPKKYMPTVDIPNKTFNVQIQEFNNDWNDFFTFEQILENISVSASSGESPTLTVNIKRVGTNEVLISKVFDITGTTLNAQIDISDSYFISNNLEFYVTYFFNQPTSWSNLIYDFYFSFYDGKYGPFNDKRYATYVYASYLNNNSDLMFGTKIDLFKSLPPIKVIDLLNSYLKTFNINIFDTSPNNDKLYFLTPEDVNSVGYEYSKLEVDYTSYISISDIKKEVATSYNYYNFKHATSKYKSNVDYLKAAGLEYGQTTYPTIKPTTNLKEYKIETQFSLMVPVKVIGTNDVVTYYGFNSDQPDILETGESRYTPNYGELSIFYNTGSQNIKTTLGFQSRAYNGVLENVQLSNYMKVLPFNKYNQSLAFSVLVFDNVQYPDSLFQRYYQNEITRLLNPNVMSQSFSGKLPPQELFLNDAGYIAGLMNTPVGFRLQNDLIIGEDRFSIIDASIDITTGNTKLTLLNY